LLVSVISCPRLKLRRTSKHVWNPQPGKTNPAYSFAAATGWLSSPATKLQAWCSSKAAKTSTLQPWHIASKLWLVNSWNWALILLLRGCSRFGAQNPLFPFLSFFESSFRSRGPTADSEPAVFFSLLLFVKLSAAGGLPFAVLVHAKGGRFFRFLLSAIDIVYFSNASFPTCAAQLLHGHSLG
jgi:hypothetical protein